MLALETQTPGLALHHARLLRQLAPDDAHSHLLVARSLMAFRPRREREAMQALEQALARPSLRDATGLGLIEERLVAALIRAGTAEDLARARELLPRLLARPADRRARKRRQELARRLDRRPGR
jgi:ribosomal protein S4